jgi:dipeptidyl-peptidase-3
MLVETYGVKVDIELHTEVLQRFKGLNIAPYGGFLNPLLKPVKENGEIIDIELDYSEDYTSQMLRYSSRYSFLNPE